MSDDRAGGAHRARREARHQGSGPTTASTSRPALPVAGRKATRTTTRRPANPLASKPSRTLWQRATALIPRPRRDALTPEAAQGAVWFTRTVCVLVNVVYGAGFIAGAPTGSSTYQAMAALMPMSWWGGLLVAFGPLLVLGRIAIGAPLTAIVWVCFVIFNARSTAWGVPVFALPALLHLGMVWFVTRGRAHR